MRGAGDRNQSRGSLLDDECPHGRHLHIRSVPGHVEREQFLRDLAAAESRAPRAEALQAAQAAAAVLGAIARSDGTRASVLAQLRAPPTSDGSFGEVGFDRWGDVRPARVAIYRVADQAESGRLHYPEFAGAVLDRVITVPDALR